MPITRTPMIDDDGTGTTGTIINNAWKQEFYNQIDALAGAGPIFWTPVDASGAGLSFTPSAGVYLKLDRLIAVWGHVGYPSTTNQSLATIGGLPFPNYAGQAGGFYQTYGPPTTLHLAANGSQILLLNPTTMASLSNAQVSGASIVFAGVYLMN